MSLENFHLTRQTYGCKDNIQECYPLIFCCIINEQIVVIEDIGTFNLLVVDCVCAFCGVDHCDENLVDLSGTGRFHTNML